MTASALLRRPHLIALLLAAASLTTACQSKAPEMTPEETRRMADLTERMTTRCVGRYLIDLPERFVLNSESTTEVEGVKVVVRPMGRREFDLLLEQIATHLGLEKIYGEDRPSLLSTHEIAGGYGRIFNRSESREIEQARTLELHGWKDGFRFDLLVNATDMTRAKRIRDGDTRRTDVQDKLAHLLKVYERIRGRKDTEIPTEQGVCFANGFLRGAPTEAEVVRIHHHLDQSKDGYFEFNSLSNIGPEDDTLLERGKAIEAELRNNDGKTLRKGERKVNALAFEEWLSVRDASTKIPHIRMLLEMNSKRGDAQAPLVRLNLSSGAGQPGPAEAVNHDEVIPAAFTPAEAIALWDKVTGTLRPRPGAF